MSTISLVRGYFHILANRLNVLSGFAYLFTDTIPRKSFEDVCILYEDIAEALHYFDSEYAQCCECYREIRVIKKEIKMNESVRLKFQKMDEAVAKLAEMKKSLDNDRKRCVDTSPVFPELRDRFDQFYKQVLVVGDCMHVFHAALRSVEDASVQRKRMQSRVVKIIIGLIIVIFGFLILCSVSIFLGMEMKKLLNCYALALIGVGSRAFYYGLLKEGEIKNSEKQEVINCIASYIFYAIAAFAFCGFFYLTFFNTIEGMDMKIFYSISLPLSFFCGIAIDMVMRKFTSESDGKA